MLVDVDGRKFSFNAGKVGILWKLDRVTGQFVAAKETVFQNVLRWKDAASGIVEYRPDILEAAHRLLGSRRARARRAARTGRR